MTFLSHTRQKVIVDVVRRKLNMRCITILPVCLLLGACAQTTPSDTQSSRSAVSLRLSLSPNSGRVVLANSGTQSCLLYRDALSLSASCPLAIISPFPKVFPWEETVELNAGATLAWRLVVRGNELYPYSVDRGGIRLLGNEHHVKAVYHCRRSPAKGQSVPIFGDRIESNEVVFRIE